MYDRKRLKFVSIQVALLVALFCSALFSISTPQQVQALCAQPKEEVMWVNADPNTRSITKIELQFECNDVVAVPVDGPPSPPPPDWYVHVFGKCHPSDCDWGKVAARTLSTGQVYTFYNPGFAKKYVYAKMSQYRPGQLWVYTKTDFVDPNRSDYTSNDWFVRQ